MEETMLTTDDAAESAAVPATAAANEEAGQAVTGDNLDTGEAPRKNGVSKRIDELVKLREEARRDAEYWRKVALEKLEAEKGKAPVKTETPVNAGKPSQDMFKTYDEYVEALTDWKLQEKTRNDAEARRIDEEGRRLAGRIAKAEEKYPDFKAVALNPDVPISPAMYSALVESEAGADIAYWLGKNPNEAGRIAALSPIAAVKEIGRLELRLSGQNAGPRRVSQAPAPVRTVSGSDGAVEKAPAEMSMEEYKAWRER